LHSRTSGSHSTVEIKISDSIINTKLNLDIDLNTLSMKIAGGKFKIEMKDETFNLLGLRGKFVKLVENVPFTPLSSISAMAIRDWG
jgi:hypothetical protein